MKYQYEIVSNDENLPIRFFYSNNGVSSIPPHLHDYVEIIYLLTGSLHVTVNGKEFLLLPDHMLMIHPNHIHATRSDTTATTAYVLQISLSFLLANYKDYECIRFNCLLHTKTDTFQKRKDVRNVLWQFHLLSGDTNPCCNIKRISLLYDMIYLIARFFSSEQPAPTDHFYSDTYAKLIEITHFINTHYKDAISLKDTAHAAGLSSSYLSRSFKKYIGINFSDYLDMVRLDQAYTLVTTTRTPILAICEECGFANYPMFVKKFKRSYGKAPLKLRQDA